MSQTCHFRTHRYGKGGIDQYQPIEKRRLLHERLIRTMWCQMHGCSAAKLSGNPHGSLETESGTPEGPPRFLPSRASFDCPLSEFKHGRFCGTRQDEG